MHRWIHVTAETVEKWRRDNKLSDDNNCGYKYVSADNVGMVEFHVNELHLLHEYATNIGFGSIGGNASVRKPPGVKPLMIFGQEKSVQPFPTWESTVSRIRRSARSSSKSRRYLSSYFWSAIMGNRVWGEDQTIAIG